MNSWGDKLLDAYIRVSRVGGRGGDSFISPDVQRSDIEKWASRQHVDIGEWHEDLDQSGGTMDRPGFNRVMHRIESGETGGVVVAKLDRFSRTLEGALKAIRRIDDAGGLFVSLDGTDVPTTTGRLHQRMMLSMNEFYRDQIRDSWSIARERAIARGVHVGPVPFGFDKNHDGMLIHDKQAELVRTAFEMRRNSRTLGEISAYMNARSKPNRGEKFIPQTVAKLLKNRTYLGEVRSGEFTNPSAHEPIVDIDLFESAQSTPRHVDLTSRRLLAGLIRCGGCRHSMIWKDRAHDGVYVCRRNFASGRCEDPTRIPKTELADFIIPSFLEHLATLPEAAGLIEVKHSLDMAQSTLLAFRDDLDAQRALGRRDWIDGLETRAGAVRDAERVFQSACAEKVGLDVPHVLRSWETAPTEDRRKWLRSAIDMVFVRPGETVEERTLILWHGSGLENVPKKGHSDYRTTPFVW